MNQAIRKLGGLLLLPVLLMALMLMPVQANAEAAAYECTARLPVTVELNGDSDEMFTVTIAPGPEAEEDLPMPELTELKLAGDSSSAFEGFYYTKPGDYVYTVTQTPSDTEYMTYDDAVYTVTIQVTNDEQGGLTYQVYASRDDNPTAKSSEISFLNTFAPPPPEASTPGAGIPQTGDYLPWVALVTVTVVAAVALIVLLVAYKKSGKKTQR